MVNVGVISVILAVHISTDTHLHASGIFEVPTLYFPYTGVRKLLLIYGNFSATVEFFGPVT